MKNTFLLQGAALCTSIGLSMASNLACASDLKTFGYLSWRTEKVWDELALDSNANTIKDDAPREISIPSFNIMMLHQVNDKLKFFANLSGENTENITVRNAWGEYQFNEKFNLRLGKSYRRFGLYNELLDAVPTYIGIEAPELFDGDHLIISRETLAMIHGSIPYGDGEIKYSFSTDNGEGGPTTDDNIPIGFDVRYDNLFNGYLFGISGYSSNGDTTSDIAVGEGSPNTGVLPWMTKDDFSVLGIFGQYEKNNWQVQAAYWNAKHNATRDTDSIINIVNNAGINTAQRNRFLIDPSLAASENNVNTNGDYDINTWYVRGGYSFSLESGGEIVPYAQWDFYENPETIQNKNFGGDNEAGLSDNGKFSKATIGLIYRPVPQLAFKTDFSTHLQKFNGKDESYPEIRFDVSYIFGQ